MVSFLLFVGILIFPSIFSVVVAHDEDNENPFFNAFITFIWAIVCYIIACAVLFIGCLVYGLFSHGDWLGVFVGILRNIVIEEHFVEIVAAPVIAVFVSFCYKHVENDEDLKVGIAVISCIAFIGVLIGSYFHTPPQLTPMPAEQAILMEARKQAYDFSTLIDIQKLAENDKNRNVFYSATTSSNTNNQASTPNTEQPDNGFPNEPVTFEELIDRIRELSSAGKEKNKNDIIKYLDKAYTLYTQNTNSITNDFPGYVAWMWYYKANYEHSCNQ